MKKILFLSTRNFLPVVSGHQIRTLQNLQLLSSHFEIYSLVITEQKETKEVWSECNSYGKHIFFVISKFKHYCYALRFLFNRLPIQVNYYYSPKIQKYIDEIIPSYDVVFCNNIRSAEYVRKYKIIKLIDFVDAISMNYDKSRHKVNFIKKMIYNIDCKRCLRYEQLILKEFDAAAIISAIDCRYILSHSPIDKKISVIGNMSFFNVTDRMFYEQEENSIAFVGKMDYEPNVLAVFNFVEKVFPLIKQKKSNVKFYIVGISPAKKIRRLHNSKDIFVTGYVPDVKEYFQKASIIVAPMLSGAGIQNKIIQAMALKRCVVTTTIGAEGLDIKNGEIAIVDGNNNIADEITKLLNEPAKRTNMGEKAYEYVKSNLMYDAIAKQFNQFVEPFL